MKTMPSNYIAELRNDYNKFLEVNDYKEIFNSLDIVITALVNQEKPNIDVKDYGEWTSRHFSEMLTTMTFVFEWCNYFGYYDYAYCIRPTDSFIDVIEDLKKNGEEGRTFVMGIYHNHDKMFRMTDNKAKKVVAAYTENNLPNKFDSIANVRDMCLGANICLVDELVKEGCSIEEISELYIAMTFVATWASNYYMFDFFFSLSNYATKYYDYLEENADKDLLKYVDDIISDIIVICNSLYTK